MDKKSITCVLDLSEGKVLMIRRAPERSPKPGYDYSFISESFEHSVDEDLRDCALRGLAEEVDIHVDSNDLHKIGEKTEDNLRLGFFVLPLARSDYVHIRHQVKEVTSHYWVDFGEYLSFIEGSPFWRDQSEFLLEVERFFWDYPIYL